jgi:hypothetical protein
LEIQIISKCLGAIQPKNLNRIAKIGQREEGRGKRTLVLIIIT